MGMAPALRRSRTHEAANAGVTYVELSQSITLPWLRPGSRQIETITAWGNRACHPGGGALLPSM